MAIQSFNDLSNAVANWMGRAGVSDITGNVSDFILMVEGDLNYGVKNPDLPNEWLIPPLRTSQMEIGATTMTILVSTNTIALPPDYLEMRRNYAIWSPRNQKLNYVTPNQMDETMPQQNNPPVTGAPEFFTIIGNQFIVPQAVGSTTTITMGYYQKIPALSATNTSNWVLANRPEVYLAGCQAKAAIFVRDYQDAEFFAKLFGAQVRALQSQDMKARYSGGALVMRSDTGNPPNAGWNF